MAQMTLQRAAHVFNRIKAETAFSATSTEDDPYSSYRRRSRTPHRATFTLNINVSVDHPVKQQVDAYRRLATEKMAKLFRLMEIGTRIRTAVTQVQAKVGITALVTQRVMVVNQIAILEHLLESVETSVYVPELVEQQAETIKRRLNNSTIQNSTTATVSTPVLTSEDRTELNGKLAAARSALMGIDDELATLNATNHIDVDMADLKVLQEAGLSA